MIYYFICDLDYLDSATRTNYSYKLLIWRLSWPSRKYSLLW